MRASILCILLWMGSPTRQRTQLGIDGVFFHAGIGFKYTLVRGYGVYVSHRIYIESTQIQPATLTRSTLDGTPLPAPVPPHVQPQYYAAIIAAEALGSSGAPQSVEIAIENPSIAGYAFYEGERLVRALLINSKAYLPTSTTRESVHIDLGFVGEGAPRKMRVKRLKIG